MTLERFLPDYVDFTDGLPPLLIPEKLVAHPDYEVLTRLLETMFDEVKNNSNGRGDMMTAGHPGQGTLVYLCIGTSVFRFRLTSPVSSCRNQLPTFNC